MQTNKVWTLPLLVLLTTLISHMQSCACVHMPARIKHVNKRSIDSVQATEQSQRQQSVIPMEFYRELDNITDIYEFKARFKDNASISSQIDILEPEKRSVQRFNAVAPKAATCMPESTTVSLTSAEYEDPNIIYIPKCTRVKRCGGCCNSPGMSCQPVGEPEVINFEVSKYRYDRGEISKEIIPVEQHTRCKCGCRITKNDCTLNQEYDAANCRCICRNYDALNKCVTQELKKWDATSCTCVCRDTQSCTTGLHFDENQCRCIDRTDSRLSLAERRRYIVPAIPVEVEPDNSTLYSL